MTYQKDYKKAVVTQQIEGDFMIVYTHGNTLLARVWAHTRKEAIQQAKNFVYFS